MQSVNAEISLCNFYIFNPTYGMKEGEEEEKIFFFHPSQTNTNSQIKTVGLSEAIIKFTKNFISHEDCKSVHMLKTRQFFYQPELNYWMIMTLKLPQHKENNKFNEVFCYDETLHDDVYYSMLKQAYEMYKLFFGSFVSFSDSDNDPTDLRKKVQQFFPKYLRFMKIANSDIIDVFQGMQFLPIDKKTYLHAQSFMNLLHSVFHKQVEFSALLVNHHLVWSNVEAAHLRVIYRYLESTLWVSYSTVNTTESSLTGLYDCELAKQVTFENDSNNCRFVSCLPFYDNDNNSSIAAPRVFIKCEGRNYAYHLLVYNVHFTFICLFIPESIELSSGLLQNIENFIKLKLVALASELSLYAEKKRSLMKTSISISGNPFNYIYFNRLNLAQKNTLRDSKTHLSSEVLSVLSDICFDEKRERSSGETVVKTYEDIWVVGQFCNEREFYVVTQQKNTSLIEINDEMKKICDKQLKSIFFHI